MGIIGIYAFCVPFRTFLTIGWLVGILFLINGIEMVAMAFAGKKKDILKCIIGIIAAIVGVVLLFSGVQRVLTDVMIAYLAGFCIAFFGIFQVVSGVRNRKEEKGKSIFSIILGVISIILGLLAVGHPVLTMISLGYLIAFELMMQGIDMIVMSLSMGKKEEA